MAAMKKTKMKLGFKILFIVILSFLFVSIIFTTRYYSSLTPINKNDTSEIDFTIESGTPTSVFISQLESTGLIKNSIMLKIYAKLHPGVPKAGKYVFSKSLSAIEIYNMIIDGKVTYDTTWITFKEGNRLTDLAKEISNNYDYTYDEVMSKLDDREFISSLIEKYDILTEDILKSGIYHPLEGYLFPETYEFLSDASIEFIIESMINQTEKELSKYTSDIESSNLSMHELLTAASLIEMESYLDEDKKNTASVIYNRINSGWTLGLDATTYYGAGKELGEDIGANLDDCNGYNTRGSCVIGLPIGPIASSSLKSIEAALNPNDTNYYYFVSDINRKMYFDEDEYGFNNTIARLINEGLWLYS